MKPALALLAPAPCLLLAACMAPGQCQPDTLEQQQMQKFYCENLLGAGKCYPSSFQPTCSIGPEDQDQSFAASANTCAPDDTDDDCITCAKTSCCAPSVACASESSCTCLLACRAHGCTPTEIAKCGPDDDTFDVESSCLSNHCASECRTTQ